MQLSGELIGIDFEFKYPSEPHMGLISCALSVSGAQEVYWLWDGSDTDKLIERLYDLKHGIFIGYSIQQAEARCFAALGLNPNEWNWRDLLLEWRWLRNGDYNYSYGDVIVNGFPRKTFPPLIRVGKHATKEEELDAKIENENFLDLCKAELGDNDAEYGLNEAGWSMLDCMYYFQVINYSEYSSAIITKKYIRDDVIINGVDSDIDDNKIGIIDYNISDISDILVLARKISEAMNTVGKEEHLIFKKGDYISKCLDSQDILKVQLGMGDWAARLAKYGQRGIPIHRGRLNTLLDIVPKLQEEAIYDWNREHPETPLYRIGFSSKVLGVKTQPVKCSPYVKNVWTKDSDMVENLIEQFCTQSGLKDYPRTKTGKPDTSKKIIDRYASGENLLKLYQRHQAHLSALKTFSKNKQGKVEALDYIGSDNKQRPDFGPYGTQTARNGAKAKSLCFLGPHWLRVLVDPEPGMCVCDIDYSSQEVFIAGSISGDEQLKKAYSSNDVYMYYAQLTGMYPKNLPIPTEEQRSEGWFQPYKKIRNISKTLNLSMQFGAGAKAVAAAVRDTLKDNSITDDMGTDWVNDYKAAYPDYTDMVNCIRNKYTGKDRYGKSGLMLPSGWRMGTDNPSVLSASNLPIQGMGSEILREACKELDANGICVIATLHDAITIYCKESEVDQISSKAVEIMKAAADNVLGETGMKVGQPEIVRHGEYWIHSERAKATWSKLEQYFHDSGVPKNN